MLSQNVHGFVLNGPKLEITQMFVANRVDKWINKNYEKFIQNKQTGFTLNSKILQI